MARETRVRALRRGPVALALALALLAVASIGASAMLLTNTITLNVQGPRRANPISSLPFLPLILSSALILVGSHEEG